jgi:hypothetical protein
LPQIKAVQETAQTSTPPHSHFMRVIASVTCDGEQTIITDARWLNGQDFSRRSLGNSVRYFSNGPVLALCPAAERVFFCSACGCVSAAGVAGVVAATGAAVELAAGAATGGVVRFPK